MRAQDKCEPDPGVCGQPGHLWRQVDRSTRWVPPTPSSDKRCSFKTERKEKYELLHENYRTVEEFV